MHVRLAKIRLQAILLSAAPLLFLVLLAVLSAWLVSRAESISAASSVATRELSASDALYGTIAQASRAVTLYSRTHAVGDLTSYRQAMAGYPAQRDALVRQAPASIRQAALAYARVTEVAMAVIARYLALERAGNAAGARAYAATPAVRRLDGAIESAKSRFDQRERAYALTSLTRFSRWIHTVLVFVLVACVAGIVATLFSMSGFGLRLVRRLERLADNVRRLGAGQAVAPLEGGDEISVIDRLFLETTRRLRDALRQKDELLSAYEREHHVAATLQRALLPQTLPAISGLRIDAAYMPAAKTVDIGGDWYDVFELADGRLAIGVGDVAGHDLHAATVMGGVRQAIRVAAVENPDPATVLRRVNRTLCTDEHHRIVTAFFGVLDLSDGVLHYAVGGHPPPLVVSPERDVTTLDGAGLALGINRRHDFETFETQLELGGALVLYTDGMVEAERDYDLGMAALERAVAAEAFSPGGNIAQQIQDRVFAQTRPRDDAAVLFIGITDLSPAPVRAQQQVWRLNAKDEGAAHRVRRALLWSLGEFASPSSDFAAAEAVIGELLSNVARHTPGPAEVALEFNGEIATLRVTDRGLPFGGTGEHPPDVLAESGRGLFLVRALAQRFEVTHTGEGNRVTVELPVRVVTPQAIGAA